MPGTIASNDPTTVPNIDVGGGYGGTGLSVDAAGNLQTNGNATIDGTLGVTGNTTLVVLGTTGVATLDSAVITNGATVGTTLGVTGVSTLASAVITAGATVGTTLGVTGVATLDSAVITNGATVGTTLGVTGATTLSTLGTTGLATLESGDVTNNLDVGGALDVTGAISTSGNLDLTGGASVITSSGGYLAIRSTASNVYFDSTLDFIWRDVGGSYASRMTLDSATGDLDVTGALDVTGDLTVTGDTITLAGTPVFASSNNTQITIAAASKWLSLRTGTGSGSDMFLDSGDEFKFRDRSGSVSRMILGATTGDLELTTGDLTITAGNLTIGGNTITLAGTPTITAGANLITLTNTTTTGGLLIQAGSSSGIIYSDAAGSFIWRDRGGGSATRMSLDASTGDLDVTGDLAITAGELTITAVHIATAVVATTVGDVKSGTYTPTFTAISAETTALTAVSARWSRSGDVVTVSCICNITPTTGTSLTRFKLSLPLTTTLATDGLSGVGTVSGGGAFTPCVLIKNGNDAQVSTYSTGTSSVSANFTFQYVI